MKTPDEIKKGLACCGTRIDGGRMTKCSVSCMYITEGIFCRNILHTDALAYIQQLEKRLADVNASPFDGGMSQAEYLNGEAGADG